MALERLPPTCMAGRGDNVCGGDIRDHTSGWETRAAGSKAGTATRTHTRQLVWDIARQLWVTVDAPARTPLKKTSFETLRSEARQKARAWFDERQAKSRASAGEATTNGGIRHAVATKKDATRSSGPHRGATRVKRTLTAPTTATGKAAGGTTTRDTTRPSGPNQPATWTERTLAAPKTGTGKVTDGATKDTTEMCMARDAAPAQGTGDDVLLLLVMTAQMDFMELKKDFFNVRPDLQHMQERMRLHRRNRRHKDNGDPNGVPADATWSQTGSTQRGGESQSVLPV